MPVYWTNVKKTKKDTTHLISMSWYRNAFYHSQNRLKQEIGGIVKAKLRDEDMEPIDGKYEVIYTYHYKNKASDLLNCGAMSSKILLDVLQTEGYVINDNVQYCIHEDFYVGEVNKDNPHMQIQIKEIKSNAETDSN